MTYLNGWAENGMVRSDNMSIVWSGDLVNSHLNTGALTHEPYRGYILEIQRIEQMNHIGTLNRKTIFEQFFSDPFSVGKCDIEHQQDNGMHEISLQDLEGPFFLLLLGIAFSFVVFAAEITYYKIKRSSGNNFFCKSMQR
ncbi:hypothetical protein AVEN_121866-1 [Araneus ventricosus]|uniref:Uncharacterized protein n=1 Tax=Araneus ventricosus TaxID=182803 RepID=A0A4Y2JQ28_ARAVE|nr:hypothetical protein AVEN_121866-1 [Araneus ventricosus]